MIMIYQRQNKKIKMEQYRQINTEENYNKLLNSGMFWEFYPELTGQWNSDKKLMFPNDIHIQIEKIDTKGLREECKNYIDFVKGDSYSVDRLSKYKTAIFEEALEACYGKDVWVLIKGQLN